MVRLYNFVFIAVLLSNVSFSWGKPQEIVGLEVTSIEIQEDRLGYATFAGTVMNNSNQVIYYPQNRDHSEEKWPC